MSRYFMLLGLAVVILAPGVFTFMLRHQTDASGSVTEQQALNTALPCATKLAGQFLLDLGQRTLHLPSNVVIPCYDSRQLIEAIAQNQPLDVAMLVSVMNNYLDNHLNVFTAHDSSLAAPFEQVLSLTALRTGAQVKEYTCGLQLCVASLTISDISQAARIPELLAQHNEKPAINRAFYWLSEPGDNSPSVVNMLIMQW